MIIHSTNFGNLNAAHKKQAEAFDDMLDKNGQRLDMVVNIDVEDDEVIKRLSGRRQCRNCGEGYHIVFKRPLKEGVCDKCGGPLYQRDDDKEDTIKERLRVYRDLTRPLLDYYARAGILRTVSGIGRIEDIFRNICSLIDGARHDSAQVSA